MTKEILPDYRIVKLDETSYWHADIRENAERVYGVYVFDRNLQVHCCSATPNYELHFIENAPVVKEGVSEDVRDSIYEDMADANSREELISYHGLYTMEAYISSNPALVQSVEPDDDDEDPYDNIAEGWHIGALSF